MAYPSLRDSYELPQLRLVLDTAVTLAAAIVAVLAGIRFSVEGRRLDFVLCGGFFLAALSTFAFGIAPAFGGETIGKTEAWAGMAGKLLAAGLIAVAPFARGRILARERALRWSILALLCLAGSTWLLSWSLSIGLPSLNSGEDQPLLLIFVLAIQALLSLVALQHCVAPESHGLFRPARPLPARPRVRIEVAGHRLRQKPDAVLSSREMTILN